MPKNGPDQVWDVDLLKQKVSELQKEVTRLTKELQHTNQKLKRTRAAESDPRREILELRRLVQDGHVRERHKRSRYLQMLESTNAESLGRAPQTGQSRIHTAFHDHVGGQEPVVRVDPSIIDRMQTDEKVQDFWPTPEAVLPALAVHPGWGNYATTRETAVVIGISLWGLDATRCTQVIELVVEQQLRTPELIPLFVTDIDDFQALREEHFLFEYLPPWPGKDVEPSRARWEEFLIDRVALIKRKWGITRFVSFAGVEGIASIGLMDIGKHLSESVEKGTE